MKMSALVRVLAQSWTSQTNKRAIKDSFRWLFLTSFTRQEIKGMEHCNCGHQRRQHGANLECRNCDCLKYKAVGDKRKDKV